MRSGHQAEESPCTWCAEGSTFRIHLDLLEIAHCGVESKHIRKQHKEKKTGRYVCWLNRSRSMRRRTTRHKIFGLSACDCGSLWQVDLQPVLEEPSLFPTFCLPGSLSADPHIAHCPQNKRDERLNISQLIVVVLGINWFWFTFSHSRCLFSQITLGKKKKPNWNHRDLHQTTLRLSKSWEPQFYWRGGGDQIRAKKETAETVSSRVCQLVDKPQTTTAVTHTQTFSERSSNPWRFMAGIPSVSRPEVFTDL